RDAELAGGLDVVEDALGDVDVTDLAAMVIAENLPVQVRRLVPVALAGPDHQSDEADLAADDRVVELDADHLHGGVEQVTVGVREDAESPTARTRVAQARTHVVEDRPLRKRSREGARLALGQSQTGLLRQLLEGDREDLAVREPGRRG